MDENLSSCLVNWDSPDGPENLQNCHRERKFTIAVLTCLYSAIYLHVLGLRDQEASATAGFAYGILKARRSRLLPPDVGVPGVTKTFDEIALAAIGGMLTNVSEEGELLQTSFGTGMGYTLQFYKDIPKTAMPYGQAMAIMALGEYARTFL
ncbi:hypothetical protein BX600DRAFT_439343 [Xylariales sp. PMI_506]|nr:hypothetical protein BX600DRAFT_439343 [Xylariales sp. PMI_506]